MVRSLCVATYERINSCQDQGERHLRIGVFLLSESSYVACTRACNLRVYGSSLTHLTILSLSQIAFIPGHCQAPIAAVLKDAVALSILVPDSALQPAKTKQAARIARPLNMRPRAMDRLRFLLRLDGKCSSWIGGLVISLCLCLIGLNSTHSPHAFRSTAR